MLESVFLIRRGLSGTDHTGHVAIDQRRQRSQVLPSHLLELLRFYQHTLNQESVHVDQTDLQEVER